MKIVDAQTFLALPAGVVASKWQPAVFEPIFVKGDSIIGHRDAPFDFFYSDLVDGLDTIDDLHTNGVAPLDTDRCSRDGCFDEDQLYAVWSGEDVMMLANELQTHAESTAQAYARLQLANPGVDAQDTLWGIPADAAAVTLSTPAASGVHYNDPVGAAYFHDAALLHELAGNAQVSYSLNYQDGDHQWWGATISPAKVEELTTSDGSLSWVMAELIAHLLKFQPKSKA